jgi:hypothetical protein
MSETPAPIGNESIGNNQVDGDNNVNETLNENIDSKIGKIHQKRRDEWHTGSEHYITIGHPRSERLERNSKEQEKFDAKRKEVVDWYEDGENGYKGFWETQISIALEETPERFGNIGRTYADASELVRKITHLKESEDVEAKLGELSSLALELQRAHVSLHRQLGHEDYQIVIGSEESYDPKEGRRSKAKKVIEKLLEDNQTMSSKIARKEIDPMIDLRTDYELSKDKMLQKLDNDNENFVRGDWRNFAYNAERKYTRWELWNYRKLAEFGRDSNLGRFEMLQVQENHVTREELSLDTQLITQKQANIELSQRLGRNKEDFEDILKDKPEKEQVENRFAQDREREERAKLTLRNQIKHNFTADQICNQVNGIRMAKLNQEEGVHQLRNQVSGENWFRNRRMGLRRIDESLNIAGGRLQEIKKSGSEVRDELLEFNEIADWDKNMLDGIDRFASTEWNRLRYSLRSRIMSAERELRDFANTGFRKDIRRTLNGYKHLTVFTKDTILTLLGDVRNVVRETPQNVRRKIDEFRQGIHNRRENNDIQNDLLSLSDLEPEIDTVGESSIDDRKAELQALQGRIRKKLPDWQANLDRETTKLFEDFDRTSDLTQKKQILRKVNSLSNEWLELARENSENSAVRLIGMPLLEGARKGVRRVSEVVREYWNAEKENSLQEYEDIVANINERYKVNPYFARTIDRLNAVAVFESPTGPEPMPESESAKVKGQKEGKRKGREQGNTESRENTKKQELKQLILSRKIKNSEEITNGSDWAVITRSIGGIRREPNEQRVYIYFRSENKLFRDELDKNSGRFAGKPKPLEEGELSYSDIRNVAGRILSDLEHEAGPEVNRAVQIYDQDTGEYTDITDDLRSMSEIGRGSQAKVDSDQTKKEIPTTPSDKFEIELPDDPDLLAVLGVTPEKSQQTTSPSPTAKEAQRTPPEPEEPPTKTELAKPAEVQTPTATTTKPEKQKLDIPESMKSGRQSEAPTSLEPAEPVPQPETPASDSEIPDWLAESEPGLGTMTMPAEEIPPTPAPQSTETLESTTQIQAEGKEEFKLDERLHPDKFWNGIDTNAVYDALQEKYYKTENDDKDLSMMSMDIDLKEKFIYKNSRFELIEALSDGEHIFGTLELFPILVVEKKEKANRLLSKYHEVLDQIVELNERSINNDSESDKISEEIRETKKKFNPEAQELLLLIREALAEKYPAKEGLTTKQPIEQETSMSQEEETWRGTDNRTVWDNLQFRKRKHDGGVEGFTLKEVLSPIVELHGRIESDSAFLGLFIDDKNGEGTYDEYSNKLNEAKKIADDAVVNNLPDADSKVDDYYKALTSFIKLANETRYPDWQKIPIEEIAKPEEKEVPIQTQELKNIEPKVGEKLTETFESSQLTEYEDARKLELKIGDEVVSAEQIEEVLNPEKFYEGIDTKPLKAKYLNKGNNEFNNYLQRVTTDLTIYNQFRRPYFLRFAINDLRWLIEDTISNVDLETMGEFYGEYKEARKKYEEIYKQAMQFSDEKKVTELDETNVDQYKKLIYLGHRVLREKFPAEKKSN